MTWDLPSFEDYLAIERSNQQAAETRKAKAFQAVDAAVARLSGVEGSSPEPETVPERAHGGPTPARPAVARGDEQRATVPRRALTVKERGQILAELQGSRGW